MPNFLTYYNDHSASIYTGSQELFQKRYTQYHKKKRSGYIGKCSPCKDIRSLFSGGCQIYIQYRRKWKFYRRNVKLCLPWERYVLAIKRVLFNVIRQVSPSFFFLFFPLLQIRHITLDLRPYRFRVDFIWLSQLGECFVVRGKVRRMGSVSVNLNARFLVVYYSTKQTRSLHRVPV